MRRSSSSTVISIFFLIFLFLHNGRTIPHVGRKYIDHKDGILDKIMDKKQVIHLGIIHMEKLLHAQHDYLIATLNTLSLKNNVKDLQDRFNHHASYIIHQFKVLKWIRNIGERGVERSTLHDFAIASTSFGDHYLRNYVREFVELIAPSEDADTGLLNLYSNYIDSMEQQSDWCNNGQSLNDFIYKSFRFGMDVVSKGYSIILESYALRKSLNEGQFRAEIEFIKEEHEKSANAIADNLRKLATGASTRIRRCDPSHQERGKTYLEMEKLFQGVIVPKVMMNGKHTDYDKCKFHKDRDTRFHPYPEMRSEPDLECYGYMYNCFESFNVRLCKSTIPNRRMDGFITVHHPALVTSRKMPDHMGNITSCHNIQGHSEWEYSDDWTPSHSETCGCICDDVDHTETLRKFSRHYVLSDYHNNMIITGIRFVNISNVIHLDIQQGKLEAFGFINSSTVRWRSRREIEDDEYNSLLREPISLSYHRKRVNLDTLRGNANEVLIGVTFEWDPENRGVMLAALVATFSFPTGKLRPDQTRWISKNEKKTVIALDAPHVPTICSKNKPIRESNKFIDFQTTDWIKDAAQSTIPYVDIQEVVTNPPTLLQGISIIYKSAAKCGGYIALELYSYDYATWIYSNNTLY